MIYLLLTADSFAESARDELRRIGGYRIIGEQHNLIIADVRARPGRMSALDGAKFIHGYFPLMRSSRIDKKRYMPAIREGISGLKLDKKARVRLECLDVNCRMGYSAKDIEVAVGRGLERRGYSIDLVDPEILAYCVLMDGVCYSGFVRLSEHAHPFIDPFRHNKEKSVSRAEFKIMEAFLEFGLKPPRVAIDLGAAPGGWSLFLARSGASVIAIDSGGLEYGKIRRMGVVVKRMKPGGAAIKSADLKPGSIIHIRCRLEEAAGMLKNIRADFIGDDINVGGMASSGAVLRYSRFMKENAVLIMTVKCMHRNVGRYIGEVESMLKPRFGMVRWRVLPHNRQEITLFARKR